MSSVRCPYCQFVLQLKGSKPGKFRPRCPQCRNRFMLSVSTNPNQAPSATVIRTKSSIRARSKVTARRARTPMVEPPPLVMPEIRGRVDGYRVLQKLGQGGIGTVYLARQPSMDRNVAIKVLSPQLTSNASLIAQFTREAFAAAQLSHPNLVQLLDMGIQRSDGTDIHFFSMEFIEGQTLAKLLGETGQLKPERAVAYGLQAARGLKFAHDHGLIHRDIKPDHLLLNDLGLIKVADLGLANRASPGAPSYLPPEQALDPLHLDPRADIYALGCTLYHLLTGQPPFEGENAQDVIAQHAAQTPVSPDRLASQVPASLSFIIMKMIAKRPKDRFTNMADTIAALQGWLGVESGKPFSPTPENVALLERAVAKFNGSKWNTLRVLCIRAFLILSVLSIVLLALPFGGHPFVAAGLVGFVLTTTVVYQIILGISRQTFLLCKLRQLFFNSSLLDWFAYLIFVALLTMLLMAFNLHWIWLAFAVGAVVVAAAFFSTVDVMLAADRKEPLAQTEQMLKEMRLRGLGENTVRQFICKYSGQKWEEFYETLFGFEAKMLARHAWGQGIRDRLRPRYASWREPIIAWIDLKMRRRQQIRERKLLIRLESKSLRAKGVDERASRKQALSNAQRIVAKGDVIHETAMLRSAETALPTHARAAIQFNDQVRAISPDWVHDDSRPANEHDTSRHRQRLHPRFDAMLNILFGQGTRLMLALVILTGFGLWWTANNTSPTDDPTSQLIAPPPDTAKLAQPLRFKYVPDPISDAVGSPNGALVGTLLLISIFFTGNWLGLVMLASAAIGLFGQQWRIPFLPPSVWPPATAIFLCAIALFFFRATSKA